MIGIDIVHVPRFLATVGGPYGPAFIARVFPDLQPGMTGGMPDTPRIGTGAGVTEREDLSALAPLFAAKEAVIKASCGELGLGDLGEIRIFRDACGLAARRADTRGDKPQYRISTSRDGDYAVAVALRLGSPPAEADFVTEEERI